MRIYKYPLSVDPVQQLFLPPGAHILSVQTQKETVCLWAIVGEDTGDRLVGHIIRIILTGQEFPDTSGLHFLGTVEVGRFVGHVFLQADHAV